MFEREFEKAFHLKNIDIQSLTSYYDQEKSHCEEIKNESNQQGVKSFTLLEITSKTRERTMEKEVDKTPEGVPTIDINIGQQENDPIEVLKSLKAKYYNIEFSKSYSIKFLKTVFRYMLLQYKEMAWLHIYRYISEIGCENSFVLRVVQLLYFEYDSVKTARRIRSAAQKQISELISIESYSMDDIDCFQLILEAIAFCLLIEGQIMSDVFSSAGSIAYTYIAYELHYRDRASEGITFAKEGLFVENLSDRMHAFNALGLCAADSYGKLQLAYDVYYSWISNKAVGEFIELYRDYTFTSFFSEKEIFDSWRELPDNGTEVYLMYNNLSYVCGMISDTYDREDKRRKEFLDFALVNINKAIKYNKSADCYYTRSIWELRIALLSVLPKDIENNRVSKSLSSAKKHLINATKTTDKKNPIKAVELFNVESIYADFLLDWLLEAYQIHMRRRGKPHLEPENATAYLVSFREFLSDEACIKNIDAFFEIFAKCKTIISIKKQLHETEEEAKLNSMWEPFLNLLNFDVLEDKTNNKIREWQLLLILLKRAANSLKSQLRRRNYSSTNYFFRSLKNDKYIKKHREICPIAYYTTLGNVKYLFDAMTEGQAIGNTEDASNEKNKGGIEKQGSKETESPSKIAKKNCLTLMHARHMNDPLEGLMLLRVLFQEIETTRLRNQNVLFAGQNPESYREEIYDRHYVFLKAFTERIDKLDMWNRYASDRATGKDSNGCCVQVNPETFSRQDKDTEQKMKKSLKTQDDFYLYRMIYLSNDGKIVNELKDTNVEQYYEAFKKIIVTLNGLLCDQDLKNAAGNNWDDLINTTIKTVNDILIKMIFLFKPDAYVDEKESRIVIVRTSEQRCSFHSIAPPNPKLFITPFHQVYIDKITLGPKVENPDHWMPYLQNKIDGMRQIIQEDLDEGTRISYFPEKISVRKSTIPYQD